ncbi:TetR/AcrR family transcriptional regulator [Nocardiopsis sp. NPDC055824]
MSDTQNPPGGAEGGGRSARKRRAILDAAREVFLRGGYLGTNMDEIAAFSGVSKQTVYKHFGSKESLFVEIVTGMTSGAGDTVHERLPEPAEDDDLAEYLCDYAYRQLTVVLTPDLMRLRRLVIGEVARFPELARVLHENGPARAMRAMAGLFERLAGNGRLDVADPATAASHFNWLVMAEPVNRAMLLGDEAVPPPEELRRHAEEGVRVFLAAYGRGSGRPAE